MNFTPEQIAKAKAAKSVEELFAYAKEADAPLTEDEAKFYFAQWHKEGELADKELDNISGGSQCIDGKTYSSDPPYRLITTIGNSCPAYAYGGFPGGIDNGTCFQCDCVYSDEGSLVYYCTKRTADNDPYR